MSVTAPIAANTTASLDNLYALVREDLARVDKLILARIKNEVPLIHDVAQHIIASGGKRIRPAMTLISSQLCGYSGDRHIMLAAAIEFIHTATLLHDDVVDESKLRRGMATANEVFGNKTSILVGDFLLSQAFQLMTESESLKVLAILSEASAIISKGEVMQIMIEGEPETDIEQYLQVISAKTAALFAAACQVGAVFSADDAKESALREFGTNIGIAFQLVDDLLDYAANQAALGKAIGDDFREGKATLPVIIAYNAGGTEEKTFWKRTLSERNQLPGDLERAITYLNKHGAMAQTVAMAAHYCQKARANLDGFASNPAKKALLDMVDFCANRAY